MAKHFNELRVRMSAQSRARSSLRSDALCQEVLEATQTESKSEHVTPEAGKEHKYASVLLGMEQMTRLGWALAIRQGLPVSCLDSISQVGLARAELAHALGVSARLLARRRREGVLTAQESERLYRLAIVIARAASVFDDDLKSSLAWLRSPNLTLRDQPPLSWLDTQVGAGAVMDVLGRIQFGIPV
jgi:putative toxin-antitoxin system antitoxin component (TIGR02293 family)